MKFTNFPAYSRVLVCILLLLVVVLCCYAQGMVPQAKILSVSKEVLNQRVYQVGLLSFLYNLGVLLSIYALLSPMFYWIWVSYIYLSVKYNMTEFVIDLLLACAWIFLTFYVVKPLLDVNAWLTIYNGFLCREPAFHDADLRRIMEDLIQKDALRKGCPDCSPEGSSAQDLADSSSEKSLVYLMEKSSSGDVKPAIEITVNENPVVLEKSACVPFERFLEVSKTVVQSEKGPDSVFDVQGHVQTALRQGGM